MPPDRDRLPSETRIGRTALTVLDLGEVTEFYQEIVGLTVLDTSDTATVLGVETTPLLVLEHDPDADGRRQSSAGLFHNAFRVPTREALGDAVTRVRDRWHLDGASDHLVSEALYLTDPEGNGIEIYRDFPKEEWPHRDDGTIQMDTLPLDLNSLEASAGGTSTVPPGTDVGHVHLEVSSLEAVHDFFVEDIGFEVQTEMRAALFVSAGGYHHHIGANTWNHRTEPADGTGLSWFEVVLPATDALDEIRGRLTASQYPVTDLNDGFHVTGPDDIEVRFRVETRL